MRIAIIFFFLILFSCHSKMTDDTRKVFRYNESKGITTLDPAFAKNQTIIWPVNQIFNGLVQMDEDLNIKPCIAHSWEISKDGIKYLFQLRKDVYFHDHIVFQGGKGRRVKATDFVYSLNRVGSEKVASPGSWIFNYIEANGVYARNDSTLEITLKRPFPAFLGMLSMQYCSVVPKEIVEYYGDDFRNNPVGTGPFIFKYWKEGEKLILLKNKNYFEKDDEGNQLPYIDAINISFINDKQSEFLEFIKGKLDFISGINPANKDELLTRNGNLNPKYQDKIKMISQPYLNTEYLGFQLDESFHENKISAVKIKQVRQAINYGFDRVKMMKYLRNNMGTPAMQGFVPKGLPSFNPDFKGYHFNQDKARDLLTEAGFKNGVGLPEITLSTTSDYLDLCEYIQNQLSEIGISIKIEVMTGATFREKLANSQLEFFRGSWIADYSDAENYLALFYSKNFCPSGPNYTHFRSEEYDRMYEKSLVINDISERFKVYEKMDSLAMEEAVVVPLYYDQVARFAQKNISGLGSNALNLLVLKHVKKK